MNFELCTEKDIENWMQLVEKERYMFPGLETEKGLFEHKNTVLDFIADKSAVCAKENGRIVGELLFLKDSGKLCFLLVDKEFRRRHIAKRLFDYMLDCVDEDKNISVSTYCDDVPEGVGARKFYEKLGFKPGKITEEFGSPVQIFELNRNDE